MLSVTDFDPKEIISGVRVQAGLYLDMLDAYRSPNEVSIHAGTSQVDFEVHRPPPAKKVASIVCGALMAYGLAGQQDCQSPWSPAGLLCQT